MKDFFKVRSLSEEGGAGEDGTPSLVAKYKAVTPGQSAAAPTRQSMRKGDKNVKDEPKNVAEEIANEGFKNPSPGWMLKQDPVLGQKIKDIKNNYKALRKYAGKDIPKKPVSKANEDVEISEDKEQIKQQLAKIADRMHSIEKSGGRIPLTDPLHQKAKALRAKLKTMKEDADELDVDILEGEEMWAQEAIDMNEEADDTEEQRIEMLMTELYFICYATEEIIDYLEMGGDIDGWYYSKLSKVHGEMEGLYSWMQGEKQKLGLDEEEDEEEEMDEAVVNEISSKLANSYLAKKHERDYEKTSANTYKTKNPMSMAQAHKSMTSTARALKRTKTNEEMDEAVVDKTSLRKKISKYEELALAANRAGDDAKTKEYQRKIQNIKTMMSKGVSEGENKQVKGGDPCWKGYQMVGMKKKGDRSVPNCVPKNEDTQLESDQAYAASKEKEKEKALTSKDKSTLDKVRSMMNKEKQVPVKEESSYKVDVEGLPTMYVNSKSPSEVKMNLRKLLRKADSIKSVERVMDSDVKKAFRLRAQGKEESVEEGMLKNVKRMIAGKDAESRAGEEITKGMKAQSSGDMAGTKKHLDRYKKLSALNKEEYKSDAQRKAVWASRNEKLDPSQGAGEYVKDFQKSDAPQFKGKTKKERQKMAVAAYLGAERDN